MWVRSQDKKILTEIHDLDIDGADQIWCGCSLLGKYSSEEKALKVLDTIQQLIIHPVSKRITHTNYVNEGPREYITEEITVFQIPKDEDVKA